MSRLRVHEVAPRDGLQNEAVALSTAAKVELIRLLIACAPQSIEITSFVRPDRVPQLADADDLCVRLQEQDWYRQARAQGLSCAGLVANAAGLDRLLAAGLDCVTLLVSASEGHSRANVGMGVEQALSSCLEMIDTARRAGLRTRAYVSMAFGCPIDGPTDPGRVLELAQAMAQAGSDQVILADTLGVATVEQTTGLVGAALDAIAAERLGLHMHDTSRRAVACCRAGIEVGVTALDSAAGGTGGCPFAPGAAGNLDTRALLQLGEEMERPTTLSAPALEQAEVFLRQQLQLPQPPQPHP